jgi:hypothetical protein
VHSAFGCVQGLADQSCQPGATWQPFVFKVTYDQQQPAAGAPLITPRVVAVSNYTWCSTRRQQVVAARITNSGAELRTNTGLFRVDSPAGTQLMLLNAQPMEIAGGALSIPDKKGEQQGVGLTGWARQCVPRDAVCSCRELSGSLCLLSKACGQLL